MTEFANINSVSKDFMCCNCGACIAICPKDCITIEKSNIGRYYAKADSDCINCGKCLKTCPIVDSQDNREKDELSGNKIKESYIGKSCSHQIFSNSQSGGATTAILTYLFQSKQIEAALLCISNKGIPQAAIITSAEELYKSQKSKYTPVSLLSEAKKLLKYSSAAIVGLPCHIDGVCSIIENSEKYRSIIKFKLGLICDRTLCEGIIDSFCSYIKLSERPSEIYWRAKGNINGKFYNYLDSPVVFTDGSGKNHIIPKRARMALKEMFTPPRCRVCYNKLNTNADIVLGDPWDLDGTDYTNGSSLIIVRSDIGECVIKECTEKSYLEISKKISAEEVEKSQNMAGRVASVFSYLPALQRHFHSNNQYYFGNLKEIAIPKKERVLANKKIENFIDFEKKNCNDVANRACKILRREELKRKSKIFAYFYKLKNTLSLLFWYLKTI